MICSKLITKIIAQKVMPKSGFGRTFRDLKCFEDGYFFFFRFLEFIKNLRAPLHKIYRKHQFNVI